MPQVVKEYIAALVERYSYRPLPKTVRPEALAVYQSALNGFDDSTKVACIDGVQLCSHWTRVVIGDYGAYLEFPLDAALVKFHTPEEQLWRWNTDYLEKRGLKIKYRWLEFNCRKVYLQVNTVKYADYLVDFYYVSVLDLD